MTRLKDRLDTDLDTFFSLDEFAEVHTINGVGLPAIVDEDIIKIRSEDKSEQFDGVYTKKIAVYVKASDLPERPVYGEHLRLDGELYTVAECNEGKGVYEIILEANLS